MPVRLGVHFMASGLGVEQPICVSRARRWLVEAPSRCGLTPLGEPHVECVDRRLVGVVLLAESHASVHGDAAGSSVYLDVFSCAELDTEALRRLASELWGGAWTVDVARREG